MLHVVFLSLLVSLVDFRYLTDALTPDQALDILHRAEPGREERRARLLAEGYPGYTTTPGWLGYSDEKLARLAKEAVAEGFTHARGKAQGPLSLPMAVAAESASRARRSPRTGATAGRRGKRNRRASGRAGRSAS